MDFNTGEIISFILTIFSTILAIIPFIGSTTEDGLSDEIYRLSAVSTIIGNESLEKQLWANIKLQDYDQVEKLVDNVSQTNPHEANLAMAVMHYNNDTSGVDHINIATNMLNTIDPKNISNYTDLKKEIWFTTRRVNLEDPENINSTIWREDITCTENNKTLDKISICSHGEDITCTENNKTLDKISICSHGELKNITENIEDLRQKGFLSNFYNNNHKIYNIQKSVDTFIDDLNNFIIFSFIIGPIVFILSIRYFIKHIENKQRLQM